MKSWICPNCQLPRKFDEKEEVVMKICVRCGEKMEVKEYGE